MRSLVLVGRATPWLLLAAACGGREFSATDGTGGGGGGLSGTTGTLSGPSSTTTATTSTGEGAGPGQGGGGSTSSQGGDASGGGGGGEATGGGGGGDAAECGDGDVEGDEACDDGDANSDTLHDACRTDCELPACGDGVVDYLTAQPEQCDDGGTDTGDGCDDLCLLEATASCGDGNVDIAVGEECDDLGTADGDGCAHNCLLEAAPTCGDGALDLDLDEQCDDGDVIGGDGCSPTCQFETVGQDCGDDATTGLEVCDDGGLVNGDACNPTCNLTNDVTIFAGTVSTAGTADGVAGTGRVGGNTSLAVDATYLYVADMPNRTIRRAAIAPGTAADGDLVTIAGVANSGAALPPVDAADGSQAVFRGIESIATDGSTLWACGAGEIRTVDLTSATFSVATVAGNYLNQGSCTDGNGTAITFDDVRGCTYLGGYLYLLDASCATLRRFDPVSHDIVTLAGVDGVQGPEDGPGVGGVPPLGHFESPRFMTHDGGNVLYIADTNGNKIRTYNTVTNQIGTFAGDAPGTCGYVDAVGAAARLSRPRGMATDGTSIYFSEFNEHTVRQGVLATGSITTLIGQHCDGASCTGACAGGNANGVGVAADIDSPWGLAFHGPTGALFVSDGGNFVIRRIE